MTLEDFLNGLIQGIVALLPQDPIQPFLSEIHLGEWVGWLNWFINVKLFNRILAAWLVAVAGFYIYQAIARWMKLIQ